MLAYQGLDPSPYEALRVRECGWPFCAMRDSVWLGRTDNNFTPLTDAVTFHCSLVLAAEHEPPATVRVLPLQPIWSGFAGNVVSYVSAWWILIAVVSGLREVRRFRRGCCPACAYERHGDYTRACPECGTALTGRNRVTGKRIRLKLTAAIVLSSILPGALLCGIWFHILPRQAALNEWIDWWSISLHDFASKQKLQWLTDHSKTVPVIFEVDVATGETLRLVHVGSLGGLNNSLGISSDGADLFTVSYTSDRSTREAQVIQIDAASGRVRRVIPIGQTDSRVELAGYADDTQTLYTLLPEQEQLSTVQCDDGQVLRLAKINYDRQEFETVHGTGASYKPPIVLAVPPTNRHLVIAEYEHEARVPGARSRVTYIRDAHKVTLWDADARSAVATLGESIPVGALAASADGTRLYAAVYGKGIQAWDLERPEQPPWLVTDDEPARNLDELAISPDGRYLFALAQQDPFRIQSVHTFDLTLADWVDERGVPGGSHVRRLFVSGDGVFLVADCSLQNGRQRQLAVYDLGDLPAPATSPPNVGATEGANRR